MLRRLRGVSERELAAARPPLRRRPDRLCVGRSHLNDHLEGPLAANIAVMTAISLSFLWRRSLPHVVAAITLGGLVVMAIWLTMPPDITAAIVMLLTVAYSTGRHLEGRKSIWSRWRARRRSQRSLRSTTPSDIFFPVMFFWVIPWVTGRTIRNQTMLARELAEKAERAEHAREEEERRAIAARAQPHRARAARRARAQPQRDGGAGLRGRRGSSTAILTQAAEVAELIQRTGREALAEIRHLFGAVRRGEGEDLSGPPSIARVGGARPARRARPASGSSCRVEGDPVALPAGIDLTAYRIVQEALTNTLKHAGSARACVTVSYEPNEVVLSIEDDGEGPRDGATS